MASFSINVLLIKQKTSLWKKGEAKFCFADYFKKKKKKTENYDRETSHLKNQPYNIFRVDIFFLGETKLFIHLASFNFNAQNI